MAANWSLQDGSRAERDIKDAMNSIRLHDEAIKIYSQIFSAEKEKGQSCSSSDLLALRFEHLKNVRAQEEARANQVTAQLFSRTEN